MEITWLSQDDKTLLEFFKVLLSNKASLQWKLEVQMVGYPDGLVVSQ